MPLADRFSDLYQLPTECDFNGLTNSSGKKPCSPQLKDRVSSSFYGIAINLPDKVFWPADVELAKTNPGFLQISTGPLRLMLAGLLRFDSNNPTYQYLDGEDSLVVAVNQGDGEVYCGRMPRLPHEIMAMPDMLDPFGGEAGLEIIGDTMEEPYRGDNNDSKKIAETYFNVDLVGDLGIPIFNAKYTVFATFGLYVSNVLEAETKVV